MEVWQTVWIQIRQLNKEPSDLGPYYLYRNQNKPLSASLFFVPKMLLAFYVCSNIQVHFRPDFFMEANNMNPDQTPQSDLGP